jgi:hypothetical protein
MSKKPGSTSFNKRIVYILAGLLLLIVGGLFFWNNFKNIIVQNKLNSILAKGTDSLYVIKYDSLSFDEKTGNAYLKNIHIIPDTNRIKKLSVEKMPYIFLDVKIRSIKISGVRTAKALAGEEMIGDSIVIDQPDIVMYSLKPLEKGTKIETEATTVYKEILGKLKVIKMGFVYVNNVVVNGVDFYSKEKNFDFFNGKFLLENVLIDSAHNLDTTRVLFCKQAAFTVDSFFSYNNDRREISVKDVIFLGKQRSLLFNEISIDRFAYDSGKGTSLLNAKVLTLNGINTNAVIKNKNIIVDSIICNEIMVYELPANKSKTTKIKIVKSNDSLGFRNVYGVYMRYLNFPKVTVVPLANSKYKVGNLAIKINDVQAGQIINLQQHPMNYTKEIEVELSSLSIVSDDGYYNFSFKDILVNSLQKQLKINSFNIVPFASERQYANQFNFQKDRYDVSLSGIFLKNIDMNTLLEKKLLASELVINNLSANIYRDLRKPLEKKNKVGNYPSQMLTAMDHEVNVSKATINSANIQYKENEAVTNETGIIDFTDTKMTISNITNIPEEIQKNNTLTISFASKVLGKIPLNGNFKFILNSKEGGFTTAGHVSGFDALELNKVSVPMALIKINRGSINSIDFNLRGNNTGAKGDFVMKYKDLKVDILKRDKTTKAIKKRGFLSMAANLILVNDNPGKQGLREVNPVSERNIYKSFFNLVWKTIFTGMKKTVGIP